MSTRRLLHVFALLLPLLLLCQTALAVDPWIVDQSSVGTAPQDTWWTGCYNNTLAGSVRPLSLFSPKPSVSCRKRK